MCNLGKIALVAIPSDKPKYHSASPHGIWAYPRECQLVQFCAIPHSGCQKFNSASPRWIFDIPHGYLKNTPRTDFKSPKYPSAAPRGIWEIWNRSSGYFFQISPELNFARGISNIIPLVAKNSSGILTKSEGKFPNLRASSQIRGQVPKSEGKFPNLRASSKIWGKVKICH